MTCVGFIPPALGHFSSIDRYSWSTDDCVEVQAKGGNRSVRRGTGWDLEITCPAWTWTYKSNSYKYFKFFGDQEFLAIYEMVGPNCILSLVNFNAAAGSNPLKQVLQAPIMADIPWIECSGSACAAGWQTDDTVSVKIAVVLCRGDTGDLLGVPVSSYKPKVYSTAANGRSVEGSADPGTRKVWIEDFGSPDLKSATIHSFPTVRLSTSPSSIAFRPFTLGAGKLPVIALVVRNAGDDCTFANVTFDPAANGIPPFSSDRNAIELAAGTGSATVHITFDPPSPGDWSGTLRIVPCYGDGTPRTDLQRLTVSVLGRAFAQPGVSTKPGSIDFGTVIADSTIRPAAVVITNTEAGPVDVTVPGSSALPFVWSGVAKTTLQPRASVSVSDITFSWRAPKASLSGKLLANWSDGAHQGVLAVPLFATTNDMLATPKLLKPADGERLTNFPRAVPLQWRDSVGADHYYLWVERWNANSQAWELEFTTITQTADYAFVFSDATLGRWRVQAMDMTGAYQNSELPWWSTFDFTPTGSLTKPDLLKPDDGADLTGPVRLEWKLVPAVTTYFVEVQMDVGRLIAPDQVDYRNVFNQTILQPSGSLQQRSVTFDPNTCAPGWQGMFFRWRVTAIGSAGQAVSDWRDLNCVRPHLVCPADGATVPQGPVNFRWTTVKLRDHYTFELEFVSPFGYTSDANTTVGAQETTFTPTWTGEQRWRVTADFVSSEWSKLATA